MDFESHNINTYVCVYGELGRCSPIPNFPHIYTLLDWKFRIWCSSYSYKSSPVCSFLRILTQIKIPTFISLMLIYSITCSSLRYKQFLLKNPQAFAFFYNIQMVGLFIIIASECHLFIITCQTPCAVSNNKSTFVLQLLFKIISRDFLPPN